MAPIHQNAETKTHFVEEIESPSHRQSIHQNFGQIKWFEKWKFVDISATLLFKVLHKYKPETKAEKAKRLVAAAAAVANKKEAEAPKKPTVVKFGLNHVTSLVESKKAKLVAIAHDVEPVEVNEIFINFRYITFQNISFRFVLWN
jgi:hypothetical protein